jgi:hypothetical protein
MCVHTGSALLYEGPLRFFSYRHLVLSDAAQRFEPGSYIAAGRRANQIVTPHPCKESNLRRSSGQLFPCWNDCLQPLILQLFQRRPFWRLTSNTLTTRYLIAGPDHVEPNISGIQINNFFHFNSKLQEKLLSSQESFSALKSHTIHIFFFFERHRGSPDSGYKILNESGPFPDPKKGYDE